MTDIDTTVRNLAAIAAAKQLLAKAEAAAKAELSAALKRGTVYAHTAGGEELGYATVPKPTKPKPSIDVVNEEELFAWMVDQFGDEVIETKVRLTEQGLRSLFTHIESAIALAEPFEPTLPPGVEVSIPPAKVPTPRFTPAKNVVELVQGMYFRGELDLDAVLAIEGGES